MTEKIAFILLGILISGAGYLIKRWVENRPQPLKNLLNFFKARKKKRQLLVSCMSENTLIRKQRNHYLVNLKSVIRPIWKIE